MNEHAFSYLEILSTQVRTREPGCCFSLSQTVLPVAARVETTGRKNQIHLSEAVANELIRHGKQRWITPREDEVEAKGMQK